MAFELPKLEYEYDALQPYFDKETMKIHHTKHHQAYTDKFNKAISGTEFEKMSAEEILKNIDKLPESIRTAARNHGGGYVNHKLFWQILGPKAPKQPNGKLAEAINKKWGSFEAFKEEFSKAAKTLFGSGWAWLVMDGENLKIIQTQNQDTPLSKGMKPLLLLDVWEHSYYLKYQNKRPDYIEAFWNVINWKKVEELYENN